MQYDEEQDRPTVDRQLLRRVLEYARPYRSLLIVLLITILAISALSALPPLFIRSFIDTAMPNEDLGLVTWLGIGMVAVPLVNGAIGVLQRWASASVGEGIIYDLRRRLYGHMQRMSLAFYTATRTGELMSRLNTDVVGAQQAVTGSFVTLASNIASTIIVLFVMFRLEWRLTFLSIVVLPVFIGVSRRVGRVLRVIRRSQLEENAEMNAHMQETLSVSGALLVKLFARIDDEDERFAERAGRVRDLGIKQAIVGRGFFMALGIMSAIGTAAVFWVGAWLVIRQDLTPGTVVALSFYLTQLYGPLSGLTNARVEFAQSLVSFERVFEVIDLRHDITEPESPRPIERLEGFDRVRRRLVLVHRGCHRRSRVDPSVRLAWRDRRRGGRRQANCDGLRTRGAELHSPAGRADRARRSERCRQDHDHLSRTASV